MQQHSVNSNHAFVTLDDFILLNSGYKHKKFKKKISEALFIKSNRLDLNMHDTSVPLKLQISQSDFICTESILFWLYGFEPSIFTIYLIIFFVSAQYELFSLPLFFFVHWILSILSLFYLFFTFCSFRGVF